MQSHLYIALDRGYVNEDEFEKIYQKAITALVFSGGFLIPVRARSGNRTRMTRIGRILTGLIEQVTFRENPSHPSHPCPIFLTRPEPGQSGLGHGQETVL